MAAQVDVDGFAEVAEDCRSFVSDGAFVGLDEVGDDIGRKSAGHLQRGRRPVDDLEHEKLVRVVAEVAWRKCEQHINVLL